MRPAARARGVDRLTLTLTITLTLILTLTTDPDPNFNPNPNPNQAWMDGIFDTVATDPERMWAEDADVLTAKLEPGFMLQARYLVITPRAGLHAAGTLPGYHPSSRAACCMPRRHLLWLYSLWPHRLWLYSPWPYPLPDCILQGSASVSPDFLDANTPRYEAFEFKSEVA